MRYTRRSVIRSGALAALAAPLAGAQNAGSFPRPVVISSHNGMAACAKAMEVIKAGGDTLDAVIAGVNIVEDDPNDHSVGYSGLPNEEGVVELDSSVFHGPSRRAGAVGALRNIKNPSKVAKAVMDHSDHLMLVGDGALRFARALGFKEDNLLTEESRIAWLTWKETMSDKDNWGPGLAGPDNGPGKAGAIQADPKVMAWAREVALHPPTGTISCLAVNEKGDVSGVTTTSGLAWKIPGRVGDSPIIGAGLFVDNDIGAGGSTGRGEENIKVAGGATIVDAMRRGASPKEACLEALRRVAANYFNNHAKLVKFDLLFYALRKNGEHGSASLWRTDADGRHYTYVVNDGSGSRQVECAYLLER